MKILIFSDIHGDLRALERIVAQPADMYIAAGDLATFAKGLERCGEILKPLGERLWCCREITKPTSKRESFASGSVSWIFIDRCEHRIGSEQTGRPRL